VRRRLFAILRKEFIHIVRDWRSLLIVILMPLAMIILYGYAITLDMRNIRFAVIDDARSPESREIIRAFSENGFFVLVPTELHRDDIEQSFYRRDVSLVVVIPRDLSSDLRRDRRGRVQLIIDATDSNVGTFISAYSEQVLAHASARLHGHPRMLFDIAPRIFYNPDMKSAYFFVPGLVALILMLISALLTSIAITREKETGTMEQILVSPVRPVEIIIGKVAPYIVLGLLNAVVIIVSARLLFDVPIRGDLLLLALLSLIYVFVALSFGLLFSTVAKTQQVAMFMTLMATILPTMMLSGFIFPVASMPDVLRWISRIIPATYYLDIIRGIMLKGIGLRELAMQSAVLTAFGVFLLAVATKRFSVRLE
jgi:ABC-2 type transport system permease protein